MRQALEVGYVRDLRNNYMVIEMKNVSEYAPFCIKMLERQEIDGLLSLEERFINNRQLLYYDITARQSIKNILEKSILSVNDLRTLCSGIIQAIETAYEYLLPEDDFLLTPDFIYQDIASGKAYLCLYPGYGVNVREQMSSLMEYLMNKVDYNDKEAVYLVYRLYAVSKEEGYTLTHLKEVMSEKTNTFAQAKGKDMPADGAVVTPVAAINPGSASAGKSVASCTAAKIVKEDTYFADGKAGGNGYGKEYKIPVVLEKVEQEEELACYSLTTYLIAGICLLAGICILAAGFMCKIVYNSLGTRLDYSKLAALIIILGCLESYLMSKLFDKKRKITRMVKTREYIDPRMDYNTSSSRADVLSKAGSKNSILRTISGRGMYRSDRLSEEASLDTRPTRMLTEDFQPTELLTAEESSANRILADTEVEKKEGMPVLKALDNLNYKDIAITNYPFFIGKLKKNVDFHLESDIVSRYHAKITKEGDSFYLTDLNSTNGTYINDELLQTYQKKEIKLGDIIAFANIKYQFLLQES